MSERDIKLLLEDILEAGNKILRYTSGMNYEEFIADEKTVDAVIRNFEIIGGAANKIDPGFRTKYPQIEWKRIRGFRNRIVHDYFGIDHEIVWSIIEDHLGKLIEDIGAMMKELD